MSERTADVVIPFGNEFLALTREQFEEARRRGRELMPAATQPVTTVKRDEILDVEGMEQATGIPASWWAEQARRSAIPHIRAGKYVRFNLAVALASLTRDTRYTDTQSAAGRGQPRKAATYKRRPRSATTPRPALPDQPASM
jgi:hypothetical protein